MQRTVPPNLSHYVHYIITYIKNKSAPWALWLIRQMYWRFDQQTWQVSITYWSVKLIGLSFSKDLYLIMTQKLIILKSAGFHADFTWKSGRFHMKNLINQNVSTKTLSLEGAGEGLWPRISLKSLVIAPTLHSSNWRVFAETLAFIRFWVDFMWNRKTTCKVL